MNGPLPPRWRLTVVAGGGLLAGLGLLVVTGWAVAPADFAVSLTRWFPPSPLTGACWIVLGAALAAAAAGAGPLSGRIAGGVVLILAGDRLLDWLSLPCLHLDRRLGFEWFERSRATGRTMSALTAVGLTALGAALAIRPVPRPGTKRDALAGALAMLTVAALLPTVAGRMHGSAFLYGGLVGHVSVPATLGILLAAVTLVALGGPEGFPARLLVGDASRSVLLRTFIPLAIVAVFLDAGLRILFMPRLGITRAPVESAEALLTLVEAVIAALAAAHLVGAAADRSARAHRAAIAALDRERAMLASALEIVPVGVVVADATGRFTLLNREAERLLGPGPHAGPPGDWSRRYGVRMPDGRTPVPPERIPLARALQGESVDREEALLTGPAGTASVHILTSARPVRDGHGGLIGGLTVMLDIGDRRAMEERLRESQRLDAVGQLSGGIAHDFNNLLTVILGHAELLLDRMDPADRHRTPVAAMQEAARRAAVLTRRLLAFGRRQMLQPERLDLRALLVELESTLREAATPALAVELLSPEQPLYVHADRERLSESLVSLVANAREAAVKPGLLQLSLESGSSPEPLHVGADRLPAGRYARLAIRDDGPGMPPEVLARVLEPFFTTKSKHLGTGLGLSTVYGFIRQSGGGLSIDSVPRFGTTVVIWLPLVEPRAERRPRPPAGADVATGPRTLLLAEDEPVIREVTAEYLEAAGWTVLRAADGREALAIAEARAEALPLLVTDLMMPHLGGADLARKLRERWPDLRVLYISGFTDAPPAGGDPLLVKPFSPPDLLATVQRVARRTPQAS